LLILLPLQDFPDSLDDVLLVIYILRHILASTLYYSNDLVQLGFFPLTLLHMHVNGDAFQSFNETILCGVASVYILLGGVADVIDVF
jgi:hypothetical protein